MTLFKRFKIKRLAKKSAAMSKFRQANAVSDAILKKEIALNYRIAELYDKLEFSKKIPEARLYAIEYYRQAASLGDTKALYIIGSRLLEQGKFWQNLQSTHLACSAHEKYMALYFGEAIEYLQTAESRSYPYAKRLLGVAYIHGWGVTQDNDTGFKKVVDSIELEGTWDKATEIFKELGLNKPEFFSAMMAMRKGKDE